MLIHRKARKGNAQKSKIKKKEWTFTYKRTLTYRNVRLKFCQESALTYKIKEY